MSANPGPTCIRAKINSSRNFKEQKNTQRNLTQRFFSAPLAPLQNSLCLRFLTFQRENTARTQRISGVEGPSKRWIQACDFLVKSLCLGVFFGPEKLSCMCRFCAGGYYRATELRSQSERHNPSRGSLRGFASQSGSGLFEGSAGVSSGVVQGSAQQVLNQKNPRVRKIRVGNSGAGNPWSPFPCFFPKKAWVSQTKRSFSAFLPFSALFWPKKGSVPLFWNSLPTLFSSKLRFFEPPNALCTKKKARVETTPKKDRKRKKHRKGDQGWLRQFYGRLEKCVLSAGKSMSIKFLVLGGGSLGLGGGGVPILFLWARGFFWLDPTPLNPTPAIYHKRKRKLRCSFRNAALQQLHCNIGFSAMRKSFGPKTALQETKNCSATSKSCVTGKWRFPAAFLRVSSPHV